MNQIDYRKAYQIAEMVIKNQRAEIIELKTRLIKYEPVQGEKEIEFEEAISQIIKGA